MSRQITVDAHGRQAKRRLLAPPNKAITPLEILLHASADSKFVVQLWECRSAVELDFESYPVDEFVTIIAGEVVVERKDGPSTTYRTGESFMLPKGMAGTWRQAGRIRKYSVCYLG